MGIYILTTVLVVNMKIFSSFPSQFQTQVNVHCPKQKVFCKNEGCDMLVFRSNVDDHLSNSCQYRYLDCNSCTQKYKYINKEVNAAF